MANNDFRVSPVFVWVLVIVNCCMVIYTFTHRAFLLELTLATFILTVFTNVIIISDIYKNNVPNRSFWAISMFVLANIAPLVYLIRRKKLLGLS